MGHELAAYYEQPNIAYLLGQSLQPLSVFIGYCTGKNSGGPTRQGSLATCLKVHEGVANEGVPHLPEYLPSPEIEQGPEDINTPCLK